MKTTSAVILAISALASADVTYNATTGEYICSRPNAQWCANGSFASDIIIRCNAQGKGRTGRCTNNLAGEFPGGVNPSLCWQSTADAGDAACEKNCVVYADIPFRLPDSVCTPYASATATQSLPIGRPTGTGTGVGGRGNGTTIRAGSSTPDNAPPGPTGTGMGGGGGLGNGTATSTSPVVGGGGVGAPGNPTNAPGQSGAPGTPGTRTPVPPSTTPTGPSTISTAAAAQNTVAYLAIVGIAAACFL